jgi:hypothetical protein
MVELMGRDSVERELVPPAKTGKDPLLNGPQLPGQAISQDDIDKLFS